VGGGTDGDGAAVVISGLRKVYAPRGRAPPKVAVVDLSLRIGRAECFGFLGPNGAGKTTTLSILTGDYLPSAGRAWIDGCDVVSELHAVRRRLGYCPQQDPLLELMTGRETLLMFARLKNLPEARIGGLVAAMLRQTSLLPYADVVAGAYSGGNKRKLSLAIALLGSPAVVFLDEPSSGMDPVSRRFMWDIITAERQRRSIVLTTHSMEECEALCSRVGIIATGRLQCLGGAQHLKSKFGGGYTIEISVGELHAAALPAAFGALFPGAQLSEQHVGKYRYSLPPSSASLAHIFVTMEAHKASLGVVNYAASQPTLEAIFLDICGAAAERSAPSSGGGGGGSGDDGGGGGGGGGSPLTRVAPAISPPMATAEAVARSAAHSGVPLAKLATPVEFDGGGLQSC
jgi:ABC-type multidrug transport system ATPase subunit